MRKHIAVFYIFLFGSLPTFRALAWDNPGHMAVATVAYKELNETERGRLVQLLRQHPDLSLITDGFPANHSLTDDELFRAMATWPDLAKQSRSYKNNGYEEHDPAITSVTYDGLMHKGWHFVDTPVWVGNGPAPQSMPEAPKVNATNVVNVLVAQLKSGEPDSAKAYDLGWLLHLVGDLHQPLHAANGISESCPTGDTGGNDVTIEGATGETELHGFWDDVLGKTAPRDRKTKHPRLDKDLETATEIADSVSSVALGPDADNTKPEKWAEESTQMAAQDAYNLTLVADSSERSAKLHAKLDSTYQSIAARDAKKRIRLAGHRLALVLKDILQ